MSFSVLTLEENGTAGTVVQARSVVSTCAVILSTASNQRKDGGDDWEMSAVSTQS